MGRQDCEVFSCPQIVPTSPAMPLLDPRQAKQAASPKAASSPSHSAPKKAPEARVEDVAVTEIRTLQG